MTTARVRVGVGTQFIYDGETFEIVEIHAGTSATARGTRTRSVQRFSIREILDGDLVHLIAEEPGPAADDDQETAAVTLAYLSTRERQQVVKLADHIREVLTGYRSGSEKLTLSGEPRPQYNPSVTIGARCQAKAAELGVGKRTVERWVQKYRANGDAGLVHVDLVRPNGKRRIDSRWTDTCLEIMVESTNKSKPSAKAVILRTNARVQARYGEGVILLPTRSTAYRVINDNELRHPLLRHSTKRNRDIAERPDQVYGKLRPTRPGEYMLMDTTRLDVWALDPMTLRWMRLELTVMMDWFTRCIVGLALTPVSTKSVDSARVLFETFRPHPPAPDWPASAIWPDHGIPRTVLIEQDAMLREGGAATPSIVPETIIVDHGQIFVSAHLTSVCERLGISVQPARLKEARDKGPVERFFGTLREDLLQYLPGYKGPDLFSRGLNPEAETFYFIDELEAIIRRWIALEYHQRAHGSLINPRIPGLRMSPAEMFEHGVAAAGFIEAPRDPDLAFEFLPVIRRTVQDKGIQYNYRFYDHEVLVGRRHQRSPYRDGKWPVSYDPDDITRLYFRDPDDRHWHTLAWDNAPLLDIPMSEDMYAYARKLALAHFLHPDAHRGLQLLMERWRLGLADTMAERAVAVRMAREQDRFFARLSTEDDRRPDAAVPQALTAPPPTGDTRPHNGQRDDLDLDAPEDFFGDDYFTDTGLDDLT